MSSTVRKIGVASLIMMGSVLLSRVIGLLREMVIAHMGGTGGAVDAYQVAFIIPEILNHVLASGFLSVTFIPLFSGYVMEGREGKGFELCNAILTVFGTLLVVLTLLAMVFAPQLISWVAPGLKNSELTAATVRMTRIIIPAQLFFFIGGLFSAIQFAREKFILPALAPLIYNAGIIIGGILLGPRLGMEGFSWGVLGGSFFGNFLLQFLGSRRLGYRFKWNFNLRHENLKKYVLLTLPLMLGVTMMFSTEVFIRFFGSFLPRGSIAGLNYAIRILFILVGLFGQAVGVASFPFLARLAAENSLNEMNRLMNDTLRVLALVIPVSILVMVLRHEVVAMLFQHGKFNAESTGITADALIFLMAGAYAFAAQTLVVRGFYAVQNTLFPAIFGTLAVILSLPIYLLGVKFMGIKGLSLAIAVSAFFQVLMIYEVWHRRFEKSEKIKVYGTILKMVALAAPIGFCLEWMRRAWVSPEKVMSFSQNLMVLLALSTLFALLFAALAYAFKIDEVRIILERSKRFKPFKFPS
ncbi:MAG: murein biosynthesis integral membrane protein MurJ [Proteobacteria bacterium]|nr:murein biosynthesis integral membrane protein MurJ [Pseudomonadota bacterium]MBU4468963.1 murein biosynthesis integral membrane protein MurJ [Pseudomonadota bacterium]MCG2752107.1 murein biosynthesis integral membrane protein MurJ [Desulfobacteraceae bacterium]